MEGKLFVVAGMLIFTPLISGATVKWSNVCLDDANCSPGLACEKDFWGHQKICQCPGTKVMDLTTGTCRIQPGERCIGSDGCVGNADCVRHGWGSFEYGNFCECRQGYKTWMGSCLRDISKGEQGATRNEIEIAKFANEIDSFNTLWWIIFSFTVIIIVLLTCFLCCQCFDACHKP